MRGEAAGGGDAGKVGMEVGAVGAGVRWGGIEAVLHDRVERLRQYQDAAYADRYRALVSSVRSIEEGLVGGGETEGSSGGLGQEERELAARPLTAAVARNYYKVTLNQPKLNPPKPKLNPKLPRSGSAELLQSASKP